MRRHLTSIFVALTLIATVISGTSSASASEFPLAKKKEAKPIPSPKLPWPPPGFRGSDGVYAKVPKSKELLGAISAQRSLQSSVAKCQEFACGAVFVAAELGCVWWEVNAAVRRLDPVSVSKVKIGSLSTYVSGSKARSLKTIILISGESVDPGISIAGIKVICHRDATDRPKFGNIYIPVASSEG